MLAQCRGSAFDLIKWCESNLTTKIYLYLCLTPAHYHDYEYEWNVHICGKCINVWEATYALLTPYRFTHITWIRLIINFERRKPVKSINWFQLYSPLNWVMLSRETACSPLSGPVLLVRGGLWRWQPVASGDLIKCGCPPAGVLALHWGQWTGAVLWHVIGLRGLPGEVQLALGAA